MDSTMQDKIRERAYELWEKEGSPHGRDQEFWERARLLVEHENDAAPPTPLQSRSEADREADAAGEGTFPASDPPSSNAKPASAKTRTAKPGAAQAAQPVAGSAAGETEKVVRPRARRSTKPPST